MTKENIHPKYDTIELSLPNGTKFLTRSTFKGAKLIAEIDISRHAAWIGDGARNAKDSINVRISKFNQKIKVLEDKN